MRLGRWLARGVNRPPKIAVPSRPQPESYPVGRTDQIVGRTGATRGYPVGRTGYTTTRTQLSLK
jgi:hypothetical protein